MHDSLAHVSRDVFGVCDAGASPSIRVAVVNGTEGFVVRKGREVCRLIGGVTVEGASVEFGRCVERVVYGRHKRRWNGPVVSQIQFASLRVDSFGSRVVSVQKGGQGWEELILW